MSRYPFPNVPQAPGVPQLPRSPAFPNTTPPQLGTALALGRLVLALTRQPAWGIYRDRTNEPVERDPETGEVITTVTVDRTPPVLVPDSFREFGAANDWSVMTAPTEQGSFAAYNKINNPQEVKLRMIKGGSLRSRTEFLETLNQIASTTDLYRVVTPERVYLSVTINRYEVTRKEARGAYFLDEVDLFFTEIRSVVSEYTNTLFDTGRARQASDEPMKNLGTKQATPQ